MFGKKLVILLVIISLVPIVSSDLITSGPVAGSGERVNFQCEDGTWYGNCNDNGEVCAGEENLIVDGRIKLEQQRRYVFFGFVEEVCNNYKLEIGGKEISLSVTFPEGKRRVVTDFLTYDDSYEGDVKVTCDSNEIEVNNEYLGGFSDVGLFRDCGVCGGCEELCPDYSNLLISKGTSYKSILLGNVGETKNYRGIEVTYDAHNGEEYDITINDQPFIGLKNRESRKIEDFEFELKGYGRGKYELISIDFTFKNPIREIFDQIKIPYDFFGIDGFELCKGSLISSDGQKNDAIHDFPDQKTLYDYNNIYWIISNINDKKNIQKIRKFLDHGGNLFLFIEDTNDYDIYRDIDGSVSNRIIDLFPSEERSMPKRIREIVPINSHPLSTGLHQLTIDDNIDYRLKSYSMEDLQDSILIDDDRVIVYGGTYGNSKIIISTTNFDRMIPHDFKDTFFRNVIEYFDIGTEDCSNGQDDNQNGLTDCEELSCFNFGHCQNCIDDGIFNGECLMQIPYLCESGKIIENCSVCGCAEGFVCTQSGCSRANLGPTISNIRINRGDFGEKYFLTEFKLETMIDFYVFEPDGLITESTRINLVSDTGTSIDISPNTRCSEVRNTPNTYICELNIPLNTITELGNYTFNILMINSEGATGRSEDKIYEVVELPTCTDINQELGIEPIDNPIRIAFYADNYDTFDEFKQEVIDNMNVMFEEYEIYGRNKNKFSFTLSDYFQKDNCEPAAVSGLTCNRFFNRIKRWRPCQENTQVVFSKRKFRSDANIHLSTLKGLFGGGITYILSHELGHNPIGLGDQYCEIPRSTGPYPYPNTFRTIGECEDYSTQRLGGRACQPVCGGDNPKGYLMEHQGRVLMSDGGDFDLPSQMRANWFFDCCTPDSCSELPEYCYDYKCGNCPTSNMNLVDFSLSDYNIVPCHTTVCAEHSPIIDEDKDGVALENDCNDNDYAFHPGYPPVNMLYSEKVLSESCDQKDYNCNNIIEESCSYTPSCRYLSRGVCINEVDYIFEKAETYPNCCGGCTGEQGEWIVSSEGSCSPRYNACKDFEDGHSIQCYDIDNDESSNDNEDDQDINENENN
ncbi:MAG: hypothetical protein KKG75_03440 [Nanoarchaeota archaeon]|nr:hypothetical protein [Nanoarchaeota archaeon]